MQCELHLKFLKRKVKNTIKEVLNMRKTMSYLYKLAFTDLCTGLSNRNAYEEKMQRLRKGQEKFWFISVVT